MYVVFTCMRGQSYPRQLGSLLYLCHVFRALINSLCVDSVGEWLDFLGGEIPLFKTKRFLLFLSNTFSD